MNRKEYPIISILLHKLVRIIKQFLFNVLLKKETLI